jgi:hypothetical protein
MPPTDPLIYRFYELIMVNGPALKALIEEEFGDGIMSAIDFDMDITRKADPQGRPRQSRHDRQIPAVQILRRRRQRSGARTEGGMRFSLQGVRLCAPMQQTRSCAGLTRASGFLRKIDGRVKLGHDAERLRLAL